MKQVEASILYDAQKLLGKSFVLGCTMSDVFAAFDIWYMSPDFLPLSQLLPCTQDMLERGL